jgi:hypothetical protein
VPFRAQPVIQMLQGMIQEADCVAHTLTVSANDGPYSFAVSSDTAVYVDSAASSICSLPQYIGSRVIVWASLTRRSDDGSSRGRYPDACGSSTIQLRTIRWSVL